MAAPQESRSSEKVGYQTRSLTRALAILDALATEQRPLSVKDLHELLDVPKPTVSRLGRELERAGYLREDGHGYALGPKTLELGSLFAHQHRFDDIGKEQLAALAALTTETSSLGLLAGADVIHVVVAPSPKPVLHVTEAGSRAAAHTTGLGKAILSSMSQEEVTAVLGRGHLARSTPKTICDLPTLFTELNRVRKRGYAVDDEETSIGMKCVGVFVDLPGVGPAAISVSGHPADFQRGAIPEFVQALSKTADELTVALQDSSHFPVRFATAAFASAR